MQEETETSHVATDLLFPNLGGLIVVLVLLGTLLGLTLGWGSVHLVDDAIGSLPGSRLPGLDVQDVHGVDLLESAALGLADKEEDNPDSGKTASSKDVTVAEIDGTGDEWGEEGDEEVPGPVGGSGDTHAGSTVTEGIHFTADSPDDGTPGGGEADDEETGEDDHGDTGGVRSRVDVKNRVTDRSPDQEADEHPSSSSHQTLAASVVLDDVQTGQGHTKVDGTQNDLSDVRVAQTHTLEDGGTVVEDEVGTGQLLQRLETNTENGTVEHARASEDLVPSSLAGSELLLKLVLHVGHLLGHDAVVGRDTVELSHDLAGLLNTSVTVGIAGRLGQEQGTDTQDQGPGKADTHGDTPRCSGIDALGTEVDDVGDEDTEGDEQLESTDHGTTDLARSRLGLVHGDHAGQGTNTQTHDPTTQSNLVPLVGGSDLHNDSDHVDESPEGDGEFTADAVSDGGGHQGADHSTDGELP